MTDSNQTFSELLSRVQHGDERAADELVRQFEPELRRFIRFRMTTPSVRQFVDSLDICQSVLGRFFVSLSKGDLKVATPEQLKALLLTMARNRVMDAVSAAHAARRDARRVNSGDNEQLGSLPSNQKTPSQIVSMDELLAAVQLALSDEDRQLVEMRMDGQEWSELAKHANSTAEAVRKRVSRALDQAAKKLGFAD